jgi:hypothetical protein
MTVDENEHEKLSNLPLRYKTLKSNNTPAAVPISHVLM